MENHGIRVLCPQHTPAPMCEDNQQNEIFSWIYPQNVTDAPCIQAFCENFRNILEKFSWEPDRSQGQLGLRHTVFPAARNSWGLWPEVLVTWAVSAMFFSKCASDRLGYLSNDGSMLQNFTVLVLNIPVLNGSWRAADWSQRWCRHVANELVLHSVSH